MRFSNAIVALALAFVVICWSAGNSAAQTFRYIDESGNIFFVDSLEQVPLKYRSQVIKTAPAEEYQNRKKGKNKAEKNKKKKKEQKPKKEKKGKKKKKSKQPKNLEPSQFSSAVVTSVPTQLPKGSKN